MAQVKKYAITDGQFLAFEKNTTRSQQLQ